jgi:hypothetical protein
MSSRNAFALSSNKNLLKNMEAQNAENTKKARLKDLRANIEELEAEKA